MTAPTVEDMKAYLGFTETSEWNEDDISSAFAAEKSAQARLCTVPADDAVWPADLAEALFRRVASLLYKRGVPSGFESSITEFGVTSNRVGGRDLEVERLEGPFRSIPVA